MVVTVTDKTKTMANGIEARVVTEGKDVTLVAYGPLVKTARDAALDAAGNESGMSPPATALP